MSTDDWVGDTKRWFHDQSNGKLFVAGLIILGLGYVVFGFGHDAEYYQQIETEKQLARLICENSRDWVLADTQRLKLGQSDLKNVKVNGQKIRLEHVKYPEVLFLDSGISEISIRGGGRATAEDLYCTFKAPRGGGEYFYNYETKQWVDKVRFRR